jgi:MFS family permease
VPPYAAAAVATVLIGYIADRTQQRGLCNIFASLFGIAGFSMLLGSGKPAIQYAGVFLGALGIYPCVANTISWTSNNVEGVYKRGVVIGCVIGWGNLNGVVSSNIYRAVDQPRYFLGHGVVLAYMTLFLLGGSVATRVLLVRENAKRRKGKREGRGRVRRKWRRWVSLGVRNACETYTNFVPCLGDKKPDFLYTL